MYQFMVEPFKDKWNVVLQSQQQKEVVEQCETKDSAEELATLLNEMLHSKMKIRLEDYLINPLIVREFFRMSKIVIYEGVEYRSQEELINKLEKDKTLREQHLNEVLEKSKQLMSRMDMIK